MELFVDENHPTLYAQLQNATKEGDTEVAKKIQLLLNQCSLQAKNMWHEWNTKLAQNTQARLETNLNGLATDVKGLEQLTADAIAITKTEIINANPAIQAFRQQIMAHAHEIKQLSAAHQEMATQQQTLTEQVVVLTATVSEQEALLKNKQCVNQNQELLSAETARMQQQHLLLQECVGWALTSRTETHLVFGFESTFALHIPTANSTATFPGAARLELVPPSSVQAQLHRDWAKAMLSSLRDRQDVKYLLQGLLWNKADIVSLSMRMQQLGLLLGRILMVAEEMRSLSRLCTVFVRPHSTIVSCTVTSQKRDNQIIFSADLAHGYPFSTLPFEVTVPIGDEESIAGKVATLVKECHGYGQLTSIVEGLQCLANKQM